MAETYWVSIKSGKVVEQITVASGDTARWSTDSNGSTKYQASRLGILPDEVPDALSPLLTWKVNLTIVRPDAVSTLDQLREQYLSAALTAGGGIAYVKTRKREEYKDYRATITGTVTQVITALGLLSAAQKRDRWPFAMAEVELPGSTVTLQQVMGFYGQGIGPADATMPVIEAKAQRAKRAIASAKTLSEMNTARNVTWE